MSRSAMLRSAMIQLQDDMQTLRRLLGGRHSETEIVKIVNSEACRVRRRRGEVAGGTCCVIVIFYLHLHAYFGRVDNIGENGGKNSVKKWREEELSVRAISNQYKAHNYSTTRTQHITHTMAA